MSDANGACIVLCTYIQFLYSSRHRVTEAIEALLATQWKYRGAAWVLGRTLGFSDVMEERAPTLYESTNAEGGSGRRVSLVDVSRARGLESPVPLQWLSLLRSIRPLHR